jgi:DNA mismatch endonuclease Vsr
MRDPKTVSAVMARIRKTNTGPELLLRKALRAAGLRGYRLYRPLPGRPDLSFGKERVAVFVDGCFWHQCPSCRIPVPRTPYWQVKIARNVTRDHQTDLALRALGWRVLRLWEHDIRQHPDGAARRVRRLLRAP